MNLPDDLKAAGGAGLISLGLAGLALFAFARRQPRVALAAAAGAGLAWFVGHRTVAGYVARVAAAKPVGSSIDPAFVDSLPWVN